MASRQILIVQTLYVFYMQEFEDVVNTSNKLYVWALRVHDVATFRELPKHRVISIFGKSRIVLVSKFTPQALHTNILTSLQLLDKRNTIKNLSVHIPAYV